MQSLLILARDTGSIIRTSGALVRGTDDTLALETAALVWRHVQACDDLIRGLDGEKKPDDSTAPGKVDGGAAARSDVQGKEGGGGKDLAKDGDSDELRLLRLRTKRRELVVVPGTYCLLPVGGDAMEGFAILMGG